MSSVLLGLVAALSWGVNDLPHAAVARRAAGPLASSAWADGWTRCCALAAILAAANPPDPAFATVVCSAFSAVTVILARAILEEPISPIQLLGMILIFGGVAGLAGL